MAFSISTVSFPKMPPLLPKLHSPLRSLSVHCSSSSSSSPPSASPAFDLRHYWTSLISTIDSRLDAAVPLRYPYRVHEAMRYSVLSGGSKRAPSVMCIAACDLIAGHDRRDAAFPTACALEMVHAASLVHDDLPCMDAAALRRGRPSNHALFGVDMAILAGDALFPLAYEHVTSATPLDLVSENAVLQVLTEIARTVGSTGMTAGQFLDLEGSCRSEAEVLNVLERKFGEMAECSAVCGGLLGGAGEEEVRKLRRYGRAVGVLYQLVDDILMEEKEGIGSNGRSLGKMRSNASVVNVVGMDRALQIAEDLIGKAKNELQGFEEKYGERVLPLYSFVDYAVDRWFVIEEAIPASAV
ncbi:Polyprenyl synthetase protein [Dioscorea alata]|uniref:Polyprenyl synthetase protein n=1 Tax=Dioscorea alata TaxID=55571 RepID=A0ACB7WP63_DIOAL|nr:Polyprenyl synthetase protein [Dioscorea alata]